MFASPITKPKSTPSRERPSLRRGPARDSIRNDRQSTQSFELEPEEAAYDAIGARSTVADFGSIPVFPPQGVAEDQFRTTRGECLQAKLEIGPVDDPLEREADHAADQVMRASGIQTGREEIASQNVSARVQRKCSVCGEEKKEQGQQKHNCSECEKEGMKKITRKATPGAKSSGAALPQVSHVLRSPGKPLDNFSRSFFEPRFGHDFARVRIHNDEQAALSARSVGALAYTVGQHIVFGSNQFHMDTQTGRQLLAHELAHTIQQHGADHAMGSKPSLLQRTPIKGLAGARLSANQLAARSREIFEKAATEYLKAQGKQATAAQLGG